MAPTVELVAADDGVDALAAAYERGFARTGTLTVGLEEELILVDPESLQPADEIESVLAAVDDPRVTAEFRASQVELVTPVSSTVAGLCSELGAARLRLVDRLRGRVRLLAAGTHPASTGPVRITDRPRYRQIAREHPWVLRRGLPSGLHVHVGLGDADEALAVYNAARGYLPELAALSANSPFFEGEDSQLASTRLKLVEDHPRSGIPPSFGSWRELASFVAWGSGGGSSPISPTSGGTSACGPTWGRSSSGWRTPRPRSTTLPRSRRSASASSPCSDGGCGKESGFPSVLPTS